MTEIRLLLADVEGALLTPDGVLTPRAERAVGQLRGAGIDLALTSRRPPRGLRVLIERLGIATPVAAFGGGMLVRPDLSVLEQHPLDNGAAAVVIATLERHGADVWVYQGDDWLVRGADAPHIALEQAAVQVLPRVVERWEGVVDRAVKIVGVSDDAEVLERCESDLLGACAYLSASRQRPHSIEVRHPRANPGEVVRTLSALLGISGAAIAAIGELPDHVFMFRESGLSIAMGHARAVVQRQARFTTLSNHDEGFAHAVETWLLTASGGRRGRGRTSP
ncbi:HAD hydrolase family protein [Sorangium sp. So ce291]|uniref:HAD hydrolase family protein n=1 Tax=Sorangium sp. So ce291 TaxID=3133294 RepID=UPI003F60AE75